MTSGVGEEHAWFTSRFVLSLTPCARLLQFADMTNEEFSAQYLGDKPLDPSLKKATPFRYANSKAPDTMDWRDAGAVSEVKDQGGCGSCWSFSATGAMEGIYAIAHGEQAGKRRTTFSEQQLVDCDSYDGGCGGGNMDTAFQYVIENGGNDSEKARKMRMLYTNRMRLPLSVLFCSVVLKSVAFG